METRLTACEDCGQSISFRAEACPKCGCPRVAEPPGKRRESKYKSSAMGVILGFLVGGVAMGAFFATVVFTILALGTTPRFQTDDPAGATANAIENIEAWIPAFVSMFVFANAMLLIVVGNAERILKSMWKLSADPPAAP